MDKKVKKKRKLNLKKLLIFLLIIYIIIYIVYYLFNLSIKNIYVLGTNHLTDYEVITALKIKDYPSIFKYSSKTMKSNLKKLDNVKNVEITKKLNGTLIIDIDESRILFYNKSLDKLVLEDGDVIDFNKYYGVPTLINYVPDKVYDKLVNNLLKVDKDILAMINEIEYVPYINELNEIIDEERFLLRMNDSNTIYINLVNIKKLNYYDEIYATLDKNGVLYLDSEEDEKFVFYSYESMSQNEWLWMF